MQRAAVTLNSNDNMVNLKPEILWYSSLLYKKGPTIFQRDFLLIYYIPSSSIYIFISWKSQNSKLNRNRCGIFDFNWSVKFVWLMTFTVKFHSSEESRPQIQIVGIHNAGLKFDQKVPVFSSKALSFLEKLPKISLISAIWAHYLLHCLSIFSPLHCEYGKMAF